MYISSIFNYRKERLINVHKSNDKFQLDAGKMKRYSSLPFMNTKLYNNQITLKDDRMIIDLFNDDNTEGLFIPDMIAFIKRLIEKRPSNRYNDDAILCLQMALISLDNDAFNKHGYKDSEIERRINVHDILRSDYSDILDRSKWNDIYDRHISDV